MTADDIIKKLGLIPLPEEGGFYKETYRSPDTIPDDVIPHNGVRCYSSQIYYLITPDEFSGLHRVKSDEVFHFYLGDPVEMIQIDKDRNLKQFILGPDILSDQSLQVVVPKGIWQGTRLINDGQWALMGCTVAPGFEFEDFEIKSRAELIHEYPQHEMQITKFTVD